MKMKEPHLRKYMRTFPMIEMMLGNLWKNLDTIS